MNDVKSSFGGLCPINDGCLKQGGTNPDCRFSIEKEAEKYKDFLLFSTPGHKGKLDGKDVTEYDGGKMFPAFRWKTPA